MKINDSVTLINVQGDSGSGRTFLCENTA